MEYYVSGKIKVQLQIPAFQVAVVPEHELLLKNKSLLGLLGKESLGSMELEFDGFIKADSTEDAKKKAEDELLDLNNWTGSLYYDEQGGEELGDGEWDVVESVNIKDITVEETGDME